MSLYVSFSDDQDDYGIHPCQFEPSTSESSDDGNDDSDDGDSDDGDSDDDDSDDDDDDESRLQDMSWLVFIFVIFTFTKALGVHVLIV